jgi:DNA-binding MarR family transcriptional regulator
MNDTRTTAATAVDHRAAATRVFAAMRHLVLEQEDRRAEVAEALGMSFVRSKALRRLVAGPLRMSELTALLVTDKPYTTLIVDDLERRGLVARSVHPDDRRCKIVTITEAGLAAAARAEAILARPPEALLALDADELRLLDAVLARM